MDDWLKDDPFFDPSDPEAAERERRRQQREERRRKRQQKRAQGRDVPKAGENPVPAQPKEEQVTQRRAQEPAPRRAPLADRVSEMRRRAGATRIPRPSLPRRKPRPEPPPGGSAGRGGGGAGPAATLLANWRKIALGIAAIVIAWFLVALFQPFHGKGHGSVVVRIPKGSGVGEVGDILESKGVISNSTLFEIRARLDGDTLLSGNYPLAKDMSYGDALDALTKPPAAAPSQVSTCAATANTCTVTIPEGYSRAQTVPLAKQARVRGSYLAASKHSRFLDPASYGGKDAKSLEGFLFPDTFDVKNGAPAADLVQLQVADFKRRIKSVNMKYARSKNLTTYDVVTIASMLERESGPKDFRNVAAVIYNRLHNGTPLGIDATIRFAVGNYTQPLTQSQLATPSPYNTRVNAGLPPGPIGNPGLAAIEAAAHPAKVNYLFYVTKPGACNRLAFARTDAQFQALVNRYNSARAAAGGKSPASC